MAAKDVNNRIHCLIPDYENNCEEYEDLNKNILNCKKCSPNYFLTRDLDFIEDSACIEVSSVPYCVDFKLRRELHESTMECKRCDDTHYINEGLCELRKKSFNYCVEGDLEADKCSSCQEQFFSNSEGECE